MNLQESILLKKYITRPSWPQGSAFCYHSPGTGPCKTLVDCDYFTFLEDGYLSFSTSGPDLYAEDLLATDFQELIISEDELDIIAQQSF